MLSFKNNPALELTVDTLLALFCLFLAYKSVFDPSFVLDNAGLYGLLDKLIFGVGGKVLLTIFWVLLGAFLLYAGVTDYIEKKGV